MARRVHLSDLDFQQKASLSLGLQAIEITRSSVGTHFEIERGKVYPLDNLYSDYGAEISDVLDGVYDLIFQRTGFDLEECVSDTSQVVEVIAKELEKAMVQQVDGANE